MSLLNIIKITNRIKPERTIILINRLQKLLSLSYWLFAIKYDKNFIITIFMRLVAIANIKNIDNKTPSREYSSTPRRLAAKKNNRKVKIFEIRYNKDSLMLPINAFLS